MHRVTAEAIGRNSSASTSLRLSGRRDGQSSSVSASPKTYDKRSFTEVTFVGDKGNPLSWQLQLSPLGSSHGSFK
ncbi:hypothetical protein [Rhodococcus jostii]|uniref:hypothetical protein n=1 Tax=Rhodococcus jostii TaxID=132919 RepID=UPI00030AFEDB|nr:hypothetical protein [Rhodococcus jostii]